MSVRVRRSLEQVAGGGPRIPVISHDTGLPGPVVCVGANLHGDECTGLGVVHALDHRLPGLLQRGRVHLYPSLNPLGLEQASRRLPGDGLDPNRAFPGSSRGSRAERHADRLWRDLLGRRPELYIDLHTDTGGAVPYAIVDRVVRGPRAQALAARCRVLAGASGLTVLGEYPSDRYMRFDLDRSLPGALVNGAGVPALTLEVGPRRRVDPVAVADAVEAVLGVLHAMGLGGGPAPAHASRLGGGPWRRESGPRTGRSGVLVPLLAPGTSFNRGAALAEVRSLDGDVRERLHAGDSGFIVALPEVAHVEIGTSCATLAVKDEAPV
jgi:predicted deacylase